MPTVSSLKSRVYTYVIAVLIGLVLIGQTAIAIWPILSPLSRVFGGILLLAAIPLLYSQRRLPKEVMLFLAFVCWAICTGFIVADSRDYFLDTAETLVQLTILASIGYAFIRRTRSLLVVWIIFWVNALFIIGYGLWTGTIMSLSLDDINQRVNPLTGDASGVNGVGFAMLFGIMAAIALWPSVPRFVRIVLLSSQVLFVFGVFLSGSRKAFLVLLLMLGVFAFFWFIKQYRRVWIIVPILVLGGIGGQSLVSTIIDHTYLGTRLTSTNEGDEIRLGLFQEAKMMFIQNPIAGVGLGNFKYHSKYGLYSHSDYLEILACTGFVGALLYFPMYFFMLWRSIWILRRNKEYYFQVGLILALVLGFMALGIGRPNFIDPKTMFLFFAILGYLHLIPIRRIMSARVPNSLHAESSVAIRSQLR